MFTRIIRGVKNWYNGRFRVGSEYLTFEQCEQYHKELWTWLAETGENSESNWSGWNKFGDHRWPRCFSCIVDRRKPGEFPEDLCRHCPIEWSATGFKKLGCCFQKDSLYRQWIHVKGDDNKIENRKALAKQIANLPWKNKWLI